MPNNLFIICAADQSSKTQAHPHTPVLAKLVREWERVRENEWVNEWGRQRECGSNTHWTRFHYNSFDSLGALDAAKMSYLSGSAYPIALTTLTRSWQISALHSTCVCVCTSLCVCARMQSQREIKRNEVDHVSILHQSQTQSQLPPPLVCCCLLPSPFMALHLQFSGQPQLQLHLWHWPHALLIQFESNVNNQVPRIDH